MDNYSKILNIIFTFIYSIFMIIVLSSIMLISYFDGQFNNNIYIFFIQMYDFIFINYVISY